MTKPDPVVCEKCWSKSPCEWWYEGDPWAWPPDPWQDYPPSFECPVHGTFSVKDGVQTFYDLDCFVEDSSGRRVPFFRSQ